MSPLSHTCPTLQETFLNLLDAAMTIIGGVYSTDSGIDQKCGTCFSANSALSTSNKGRTVALMKPDLYAYTEMFAFQFWRT